ncbi:MAG: hypothetical protein IT373_31345, partial [Polyangiaceae bacterium]|nr:hypothetical protein [Polyangiaceae bacterium]
ADGWTVGFERFVAAIGNLRLEGDRDAFTSSCNAYSSPSYDRTFDFAVLPEPAKVALAWGLGRCSVAYRVRSPSFDTLLGSGVTPTDVALMRVRGDDAYEAGKRVVLYAQGQAVRGGVEKRFAWVFRRGFALDRCLASSGSGYLSVLELAAGDAPRLGVVVRGEELFRRAPDDAAPLHFDRYAAADADGDGAITFAELAAVAAPSDDPWPDDASDGTGEQPATPPETLADLVYRFLLPRVTRMVGGGVCQAEVRG